MANWWLIIKQYTHAATLDIKLFDIIHNIFFNHKENMEALKVYISISNNKIVIEAFTNNYNSLLKIIFNNGIQQFNQKYPKFSIDQNHTDKLTHHLLQTVIKAMASQNNLDAIENTLKPEIPTTFISKLKILPNKKILLIPLISIILYMIFLKIVSSDIFNILNTDLNNYPITFHANDNNISYHIFFGVIIMLLTYKCKAIIDLFRS